MRILNFFRVDIIKGSINAIAIVLLLVPLFIPIVRVTGNSMSPTFRDGDIIVLLPKFQIEAGDICCFKIKNSIYVKRIIAFGNSIVDIDCSGNITVDNSMVSEGIYLEKNCVKFPYTVPKDCVFVMGDNIQNSFDSRYKNFQEIHSSDVIGIAFRIFRSGTYR